MKEWIDKSEAQYLTGKSISTIRRWIDEHKNIATHVKKDKNKIYINALELSKDYKFINEQQESTKQTALEETKHKKEAMQIAYNSEIIKTKDEHINAKDRQIEMLINKKSYAWIWLTIGFIILIIFLCILGWFYRYELLETKNKEVKQLSSSYEKEVKYKDDIIKMKEQRLQEAELELKQTREAYTQTLKNIDVLHTKYSDKLGSKEKEHKEELKNERSLLSSLFSKPTESDNADSEKS